MFNSSDRHVPVTSALVLTMSHMHTLMPTHITLQTTAPAGDSVFDLWHVAPEPQVNAESFSSSTADTESVWSITLPGDVALARQTLTGRLESLTQSQRAVGLAGQYLQRVELPAGGVSFGQAVPPFLPEEADLLALLAHHSPLRTDKAFAFDWLTQQLKPVTDWADTLQEYGHFMAQVVELLKPTARIDTRLEQRWLAHSILRPSGRLDTVWSPGVRPEQMALHHQTAQLTLETRQSLAFFLAQVTAGALSLTAKFYVTQWVALPAAFRFARDIMRRARQDRLLERLQALP